MGKVLKLADGEQFDLPPSSIEDVDPELARYVLALHKELFGLPGETGNLDQDNLAIEVPTGTGVDAHDSLAGVDPYDHHGAGAHSELDQGPDVSASPSTAPTTSIQVTGGLFATLQVVDGEVVLDPNNVSLNFGTMEEIKADVNALASVVNSIASAVNSNAALLGDLIANLRTGKLIGSTAAGSATDDSDDDTPTTGPPGSQTSNSLVVIANPSTTAGVVETPDAVTTVRDTVGFQDRVVSVTMTGGNVLSVVDLVPQNVMLLGVFATVTAEIQGPSTVRIGTTFDDNAFGVLGDDLASATTIRDFGLNSPIFIPDGMDIYLTSPAGDFLGGTVELTAHFWSQP